MNTLSPTHRRCKILYLIRHGQGMHNVKEKEVGREEWGRYWSKLSGDGATIWEDAELTAEGENQAKTIAAVFQRGEVPLPEAIFGSPLGMCWRGGKALLRRVYGRRWACTRATRGVQDLTSRLHIRVSRSRRGSRRRTRCRKRMLESHWMSMW
jgi:bisphosphoglycerate-dependent phosphoglycerate mutase